MDVSVNDALLFGVFTDAFGVFTDAFGVFTDALLFTNDDGVKTPAAEFPWVVAPNGVAAAVVWVVS